MSGSFGNFYLWSFILLENKIYLEPEKWNKIQKTADGHLLDKNDSAAAHGVFIG